jgi:hypothetical protein
MRSRAVLHTITSGNQYAGISNLLLLFSAGENTAEYATIAEEIERHRHEMKDRDLVVIRLPESGVSRVNGRNLSGDETRRLRTRFDALLTPNGEGRGFFETMPEGAGIEGFDAAEIVWSFSRQYKRSW